MPWSVRSAFTDTERFANMSRLRAATSIFFAVQQVCKGKTDAYKPIPEAVMDVRMGVYASTQGNSSLAGLLGGNGGVTHLPRAHRGGGVGHGHVCKTKKRRQGDRGSDSDPHAQSPPPTDLVAQGLPPFWRAGSLSELLGKATG